MKAGLRDASFYERPSGYGANPRPPKYHAIVDRPGNKYGADRGPACGIVFYVGEYDVDTIPTHQRCGKPGCKAAFAAFDRKAVGNG